MLSLFLAYTSLYISSELTRNFSDSVSTAAPLTSVLMVCRTHHPCCREWANISGCVLWFFPFYIHLSCKDIWYTLYLPQTQDLKAKLHVSMVLQLVAVTTVVWMFFPCLCGILSLPFTGQNVRSTLSWLGMLNCSKVCMIEWCGCPAMAAQPVQFVFRVETHTVIITELVVD